MPKEISFFAYLIEGYVQSRRLKAAEVLDALDKRGKVGFVHDMHEMCHTESLDNAFADLDSLIATGRPAW